MTHECNTNCRKFRGYNEPFKPNELDDFHRFRIGLSEDTFQTYTNPYTRAILAMYLNGNALDNCIIFFKSNITDSLDFKRLIFINCFAKKAVGTFNKLCAYLDTDYVCCNPDHYEFIG